MERYYQAISDFHKKFRMKGTNNEDMSFRLNLLIEELGELSQAVTRGKSREEIFEENVDLLNLVLGNFVSLGATLEEVEDAFWKKHKKIMNRKARKIGAKTRVSHWKGKRISKRSDKGLLA